MKRMVYLWALVGAMLCGQAAWAQDIYVIAVGGMGTRITSVPYTISAPGYYFLGSDLTHTGTTNAITVTANNVTLDLMGFSLAHTGAVNQEIGIYMNGRTNVEVRNGTVRGFSDGIRAAGATGNKHRVINVKAINNGNDGINLDGSDLLVRGCNASDNGSVGITIVSGIISDCIVYNTGASGIIMTGSGTVHGNSAYNNSYNFVLGTGVATSILVDGNNAFSSIRNYYSPAGTTGVVITANNSGA